MKKGKDYGLLIASMVAIVAIVGLVIMFSGGTIGAASFEKSSDKGEMRCWYEAGGMVCEGVSDSGQHWVTEDRPDEFMSREQTNQPFESRVEHSINYGEQM